MISTNDIKKLKTIFATKNDLKKMVTKEDAKRFATKDDLKDLATKKGQDDIIASLAKIIEMIGQEHENNEDQDDILEHHERRLDKVEDKVYSTN